MPNCKHIKKLIVKYVEDGIAHPNALRISQHIEKCEACREEYIAYKNMLEDCRQLAESDLPDDFHEKLHSKLVNARQQTNDVSRRFELNIDRKFISVASCVAVIILVSITMVRLHPEQWYKSLKTDMNRVFDLSDENIVKSVDEGVKVGNNVQGDAENIKKGLYSKNENTGVQQQVGKAREEIGALTTVAPEKYGTTMIAENSADVTFTAGDSPQVRLFALPDDGLKAKSSSMARYADLTIKTEDIDNSVESIKKIVSTVGGSIKQRNEKDREESGYSLENYMLTEEDHVIIAEISSSQYDFLAENICGEFAECINNGIREEDSVYKADAIDDCVDIVTVVITILKK